jgi:hypothetical protein
MNVLLSLFVAVLFLYFTADTVSRVSAGADGGFLIYIEPVIFIATARAFFRSGREYLRERERAPRLVSVLDFLARYYLRITLVAGVVVIAAYGLEAVLRGQGFVHFYESVRLIFFTACAFVLLNAYLDHQARTRLVAVRDERRREGIHQ